MLPYSSQGQGGSRAGMMHIAAGFTPYLDLF